MADYQAKCHKPDNADADRRIQGLGGDGWYDTIDRIIQFIENRDHRFWTIAPSTGQSVWIEVHKRANGRKYLKTAADGVEPNNILALPKCP